MAAPTPGVRQDPNGNRIGDGFRTLVAFNADPDIAFWEQSVTPPGLEADAPNDTSTMHNVLYRTMHPRRLIQMTEFQMTAAYDPVVYTSIAALININTTVTVHFPDGSTLAFYGYLRSFKPGALEEGKQPQATVVVTPTNADPTTCEEEAPVYTAGPGTAHC